MPQGIQVTTWIWLDILPVTRIDSGRNNQYCLLILLSSVNTLMPKRLIPCVNTWQSKYFSIDTMHQLDEYTEAPKHTNLCACLTMMRILSDFSSGVRTHPSQCQMILCVQIALGRTDVLCMCLCYLAHGGEENWYLVAWILLGEMEPF